MIININEIIIPKEFENSTPNGYKIEQCRRIYENHNIYDRKIIIDSQNVLIDGYIMYLVLKEQGCENIYVQISNRKYKYNKTSRYRHEWTYYVFAKHCDKNGQVHGKTYVWRMPNDEKWNIWASTLKVGDIVKLPGRDRGYSWGVILDIAPYGDCPFQFNVIPFKEMVVNNRIKKIEDRADEKQIKNGFFASIKTVFQKIKSVLTFNFDTEREAHREV